MEPKRHLDDETQPANDLPAFFDKHRWLFFSIVLLLHIAAFNGQWRLGPDTTNYGVVARNVIEGRGHYHPHGFHVSTRPGTVAMFGFGFSLSGTGNVWPALILVHLSGIVSLVLTFQLFRLHADRPTAVAVTVMVGVSAVFFRHCLEMLNDVPFFVGLMLFLFAYERHHQQHGRMWLNVCMMLLGVLWMAMFRIVFIVPVAAMICVAAFQVLRGTNPRRNATIVVVILVLIVLFRLLDTRGTEGLSGRESAIIDMLWTNLGHTLTGVLPVNAVNFLEDSFPKGFLGNKIVPIFNSILTIAALVTTLVVVRRRPIWLIMTVGFVASWLLIVSTSRYVLVIMPLVAFAWWKSSLSLRGRFGGRMGNVLCATMLALWIGMNGAKCVGLIIEQRRVPFIVHYRRGAYEGVRELGLKFRDTVDENAIILSPQRCSGPVMFFSGMTADMPNRMQPIDNDTNRQILVIAPMDEPLKHMFKERGWRAGPTVWSVPRRGNTEPWTLHRVIRSPE